LCTLSSRGDCRNSLCNSCEGLCSNCVSRTKHCCHFLSCVHRLSSRRNGCAVEHWNCETSIFDVELNERTLVLTAHKTVHGSCAVMHGARVGLNVNRAARMSGQAVDNSQQRLCAVLWEALGKCALGFRSEQTRAFTRGTLVISSAHCWYRVEGLIDTHASDIAHQTNLAFVWITAIQSKRLAKDGNTRVVGSAHTDKTSGSTLVGSVASGTIGYLRDTLRSGIAIVAIYTLLVDATRSICRDADAKASRAVDMAIELVVDTV